jgi:replication-associated recombination protein RarA
MDRPAQDSIINASSGDARRLINIVEQIALAKLDNTTHHQAMSHALICERRKVADKKYPRPYQKQC